jgi:YesN/AraC family two-component response regulator
MIDLNYLRVLYVEDDEPTRVAMSRFLKTRVGKLCAVSSGEEALVRFDEFKPNLVIADLIMPGMSGLEMIGEIRKRNRECHILITSTVNEISMVLEAVDHGIDHYIVKPIDTEELERKMENISNSIAGKDSMLHRFNFATLDNYRLIDDAIRREFLKIFKTTLGKGPQDIKVVLFEDQVEFYAIDAVTTMEKTIAANKRNITLVEQFRSLFYHEITPLLEECLEEITGYKAELKSIRVDGAKRIDKIVLTICS